MQGGNDLRAYYKTPAALVLSGHLVEAERVLDYISENLLQPDGDLNGAGVPWFGIYRTYAHSWICCAAMMRGRFELVRMLKGFLATYHDPASGAFFADAARSKQEIMTSSMAGLACLWAGDQDRALAVGHWLKVLLQAQPDLRRGLYTTWRDGALVVDFPQADAPRFLVDSSKPQQKYFQYGISAALLSSLAAATGDDHWLLSAQEFLAASAYAYDDRYSTPQSGKIGWGAAWTYRLSRREQDRVLAATVVEGLAAMQNGDGSWIATGAYGGERADADSAVIDITAEFTALQAAIGLAIPGHR